MNTNPDGVRILTRAGWICISWNGAVSSEECREGREAQSCVCDEVANS